MPDQDEGAVRPETVENADSAQEEQASQETDEPGELLEEQSIEEEQAEAEQADAPDQQPEDESVQTESREEQQAEKPRNRFGLSEDEVDQSLEVLAEMHRRANAGDKVALSALQQVYNPGQAQTAPNGAQGAQQPETSSTAGREQAEEKAPEPQDYMPQGSQFDEKEAYYPGTPSFEARRKAEQRYTEWVAERTARQVRDDIRREQDSLRIQQQYEHDVRDVVRDFGGSDSDVQEFQSNLNRMLTPGMGQSQKDVLQLIYRGVNFEKLVQTEVDKRVADRLAKMGISSDKIKSATQTSTKPGPGKKGPATPIDEIINA